MAEEMKPVEKLEEIKKVEFTSKGKTYIAVLPPGTRASDIIPKYEQPKGKPPGWLTNEDKQKLKEEKKLDDYMQKWNGSYIKLAQACGATVYEVGAKGEWVKVEDEKALAKAGAEILEKARAAIATVTTIKTIKGITPKRMVE